MTLLKIILLAFSIFSLVDITITLIQMGMVLKNKGKATVPAYYFTIYSFVFAITTAILVMIW